MANNTDDVLDNWEDEDAEVRAFRSVMEAGKPVLSPDYSHACCDVGA